MSNRQSHTTSRRSRRLPAAVAIAALASAAWATPPALAGGGNWGGDPVNTIPPAVTGQPVQGKTLTTTNGTWTNTPSGYTYAWQDCDSTGNNCYTITGATAPSYTLQAGDIGHTIRSVVTAVPQDPHFPSDPMAPSATVGAVLSGSNFAG
jgi:hypothetical protein